MMIYNLFAVLICSTATVVTSQAKDDLDISGIFYAANKIAAACIKGDGALNCDLPAGRWILHDAFVQYGLASRLTSETGQPVSDADITNAMEPIRREALKRKQEYIDEMKTEESFMAAAGIAQTLAACSAWFPPAAFAFDATAAVSFAGAATAEAVLLLRKSETLGYISSIHDKIADLPVLQPLKMYVNVAVNISGSLRNANVDPDYGRAVLHGIQMYLEQTGQERNDANMIKQLYHIGVFQDMSTLNKQKIMNLVKQLRLETIPAKINEIQQELEVTWQEVTAAVGPIVPGVVTTVLAVKNFNRWNAARIAVNRIGNVPRLGPKGRRGAVVEDIGEQDPRGFFERNTQRLSKMEIFGAACQGFVGTLTAAIEIYSLTQISKIDETMTTNINHLIDANEDYYKNVSKSFHILSDSMPDKKEPHGEL